MSKTLEVFDHDAHFNNLPFKPIILNDVPAKTKEERQALNELITTTYSHTDTLEPVPSCAPSCGNLSHGHNLGRLCPLCNTRVESSTDRQIESTVWFRAPDGIVALINPILWMMLSKHMTTSKFNVLMWFCNTRHVMPPPNNKQANAGVKRLLACGIPRGFNNFINRFPDLIDTLVNMKGTRHEKEQLKEFLVENRSRFFPKHLPMPSKIAFVLEETATGTYADLAMRDAIDAVRTMTSTDAETLVDIPRLEGKMASIVNDLSNYYLHMYGKPFSRKEGWIRHSTLGTRMPFSYRTVITSGGTTELTDYEETKIPYSQAVVVFKVHLENKLCKRGMSEKEAWRYVDRHTVNKDPLLTELLHEVLNEGPGGPGEGHRTIVTRNPYLARASAQCLKITDIGDTSSTLSIMAVRGPNADFLVLVA